MGTQSGVCVGTSGWAYASWKPEFYPPKLAQKKFLEYYAAQLNSVEVNFTFRQLPSETTLQGWLIAVGEDFTFSFKAPQRITHFSRLQNCSEAVAGFYGSLAPVLQARRMGVVLYQLPPNFKADALLLDEFLSVAKADGIRAAFEFRHDSWFAEQIYAVLERHGAALCVAESDELETPDRATASFRCYRLRKSDYSEAELRKLAEKFHAESESGDVFAYFKHEEEPTGAIRAAALLKQLRPA